MGSRQPSPSGKSKPLISFIMPAKNDSYLKDDNYRIQSAINFLSASLDKLERLAEAEIVVVDWGSEVPLESALKLSAKAKKIIRFVEVPGQVTAAVSPKYKFPTPIILNVGIRLARGAFIAQILADIVFPEKILKLLFDILDEKINLGNNKTLFVFNRKSVPEDMVAQRPSFLELENYFRGKEDKALPEFIPYFLVPGDSLMMHRDLWFECQGFDEQHLYWGWTDADLILRMRLKYSVSNKINRDYLYVYHLEHYVAPKSKVNPFFLNPFAVNNKNWGLGNFELQSECLTPKNINIKYDPSSNNQVSRYDKIRYFLNAAKYALVNFNQESLAVAMTMGKIIIPESAPGSIGDKIKKHARKLRNIIGLP